MNTTKQLQQIKFDQWAVRCKDQTQRESHPVGTSRHRSHHPTYSYVLPESCDSHDSSNTNAIPILLGNTPPYPDTSTSDEMLCRIITALHHAQGCGFRDFKGAPAYDLYVRLARGGYDPQQGSSNIAKALMRPSLHICNYQLKYVCNDMSPELLTCSGELTQL